MALNKKTFQGYSFHDEEECVRAKKEWEVIESIRRNADLGNARIALQIYNKAVSNDSFHTVVGYSFLKELQNDVTKQGLANVESLKPIAVYDEDKGYTPPDARELKKYKTLYKQSELDKKKLRIVIGFFLILIIGMFIITYRAQYSIFTYFKDYETEIENRIIERYGDWKARLEEKEKELDEREEG